MALLSLPVGARRQWQPFAAVAIGLIFLLMHVAVFLPLRRRLGDIDAKARTLGVAVEPDAGPVAMPPRVVGLVAGNTMAANEAQSRGTSGALTADLFDAVSAAANKAGVSIIATEPGVTLQQEESVQIRAHVRATCSYDQFVRFCDEIAKGDALIAVDRFSLIQNSGSRLNLDLWLTRTILKQTGHS